MSSREWYFRIDDMLQALAGIAEAARHVPPDVEALYPQIPWRLMRDMRNVIAH